MTPEVEALVGRLREIPRGEGNSTPCVGRNGEPAHRVVPYGNMLNEAADMIDRLAPLSASAQEPGWRTMESAPKQFHADTPVDEQAIQLWAENVWGQTRWTFGFWSETNEGGPGWWDAAERAWCEPTHWQPLPSAPLANAGGDA